MIMVTESLLLFIGRRVDWNPGPGVSNGRAVGGEPLGALDGILARVEALVGSSAGLK
jgi:hypothetical protein